MQCETSEMYRKIKWKTVLSNWTNILQIAVLDQMNVIGQCRFYEVVYLNDINTTIILPIFFCELLQINIWSAVCF